MAYRMTVVFLAIGLLAFASSALARTWRIEKDGSGDFAIIQEAVDAAAAGDTILIGPGRFEEYSYLFHHSWDVYGCVNVTKDNLVFIGADPTTTIVGFTEFTPHQGWSISGFNCIDPIGLSIRGITFSGLYEAIYFYGSRLEIANCRINASHKGIISWGTDANSIDSCEFTAVWSAVGMVAGSSNTTIRNCVFRPDDDGNAIMLIQARKCTVENCVITGGVKGIQAEQFSEIIVRNCNIDSGYGGAIVILDGTTAELYDNYLTADQIVLDYDGQDAFLIATGNIFEGGSYATLWTFWNTMDFHGNHIISGGGYAIEATMGGSTPIILDLTDNYWGTDNAAEIAALILDHNDFDQYDPSHWVIVDYEPFAPHEIETESTTWGAVKSMFR